MTSNPGIWIAAAVRRTDRRIVAQLRSAGASTPEKASAVKTWNRLSERRLHHLEQVGALRRAGTRQFYLDEARWESHRRMKRTFALSVAGAGTAVALLLWVLSGSKP
jgi:predicted exporter